MGVRCVLRYERLTMDYVGGFLLCLRVRRGVCEVICKRICWLIIKKVLRNARCKNKDN